MGDALRVVVTGGTGFLGLHLAARLVQDGAAVTVVDTRPPAAELLGAGVRHLQADVRDEAALRVAFDGADAVVHAAFATPQTDLGTLRTVNVDGTRSAVGAARHAGVPRLVLVSSTIVQRPPRVHPLSRTAPLSRLDLYRSTRVEAERIVLQEGADLQVAVVRPKTFVGPGRVGAFALVFDLVADGARLPLTGPGDNRYQLLDVRDLADALARLVRTGEGVFHLGATTFGTVAEDLDALLAHAGTGSRLQPLPRRLAQGLLRAVELAGLAPLAEWHQCAASGRDSVVDVSRARDELGWVPAWSNAASLVAAYDAFLALRARHARVPTTRAVPAAHRLARRLLGAAS